MGYIIGIDLGGMSAKAAIFDGEGRILAKSNIATNLTGRRKSWTE